MQSLQAPSIPSHQGATHPIRLPTLRRMEPPKLFWPDGRRLFRSRPRWTRGVSTALLVVCLVAGLAWQWPQ